VPRGGAAVDGDIGDEERGNRRLGH
jgi:hypothetical protein